MTATRQLVSRVHLALASALILALAAFVVSSAALTPARAADMPDEGAAKAHIRVVADSFFDILKAEDISETERRSQLKDLMVSEVAVDYVAKLSLGRHSRISSSLSVEEQDRRRAQLEEYHALFPDFIFNKMYDLVLSKFGDSTVEVTGATPLRKTDLFVHTTINRPAQAPIMADWRLRRNKDGELKIIDLKAEGVSMTITQRDDFASVLGGSGDIAKVVTYMRAQIAAAKVDDAEAGAGGAENATSEDSGTAPEEVAADPAA